jgi:hypothetical protein
MILYLLYSWFRDQLIGDIEYRFNGFSTENNHTSQYSERQYVDRILSIVLRSQVNAPFSPRFGLAPAAWCATRDLLYLCCRVCLCTLYV